MKLEDLKTARRLQKEEEKDRQRAGIRPWKNGDQRAKGQRARSGGTKA